MSDNKNKKLDEILDEIKNNSSGQSAEELLLAKLNKEQREKLKSIISNDEAVKNFLSSEQAQKIIRKMTGKGE
ncbi:MAG: hypothetical protein K5755_06050 [Clostridiales bacterium]|nr:hypothetical protein [Clostridia bacterium]MCR4564179.1 hypothetical protein [Clostridiales bacterium]